MSKPGRLFVVVGLAVLAGSYSIGCMGAGVVSPLDVYEEEVVPIQDEWLSVINDWDDAANDPEELAVLYLHAEASSSKMEKVLASWDEIAPPSEAGEYHLWIRRAMDYEREAFRTMGEYYRLGPSTNREEYNRSRDLTTRLWVLKDEALLRADAVSPE